MSGFVVLLPDETLQFFTGKPQVQLTVRGKTAIRHLVEAAGIPPVEVGTIWVNGHRLKLEDHVHGGESIRVSGTAAPCPPHPIRFIADLHLGRLAAYLRMLGFDTLYRSDAPDHWLAETAAAEGRLLLTRDRRLLMYKIVRWGYCPRSLEPEEQLREVVARYELKPYIRPFARCLRCNTPLETVEKAAILHRLEPLTRLYYDEFRRCPHCDQIYWRGSHYERMQALIARL